LAVLFAAVFLVLSLALLAVVYWTVNTTQMATLEAAVDSDIAMIQNAFHDEGVQEAVEVVKQRLGPAEPDADSLAGYYLIENPTGGKLAGNLAGFPATLGPSTRVVPRGPKLMTVMGRGVLIGDGNYLFVGRNTHEMALTNQRLLRAFVWEAAVCVILAAIVGTLLSLRFMGRIDAITHTCEAIIGGKFNDRIPLRGNGDELDRLARAINRMLDRISALLENLRQVSSDVAHDLRTPLTHLRGRLEHAREKSASVNDYAAAVELAIADTDRVLAIFGALLRISQVESGSRLKTFADVSLSELLERLFELYRPVAEDHAQQLRHSVHDQVTIRGDLELLTQLFSNLIENALRHTSKGSTIDLRLQCEGAIVTATVADNGPGIPAAERNHVLQRFYRLAHSRSMPGSGLGLALAAAIADLHAAQLRLDDNAPGLRVSVIFPR
jgi:signal transduction histidine kinase